MEFGMEQLNTFILDSWKDQVYYEEQAFPAGHFVTGTINRLGRNLPWWWMGSDLNANVKAQRNTCPIPF